MWKKLIITNLAYVHKYLLSFVTLKDPLNGSNKRFCNLQSREHYTSIPLLSCNMFQSLFWRLLKLRYSIKGLFHVLWYTISYIKGTSIRENGIPYQSPSSMKRNDKPSRQLTVGASTSQEVHNFFIDFGNR